MGVKLSGLIEPRTIRLDDLSGRIIAIDAFNMLYQFLATIRGPDGTPLKTRDGRVSSHLVGLFSRTANFLEKDIKPVFIFDGKPPELKRAEQERRRELRASAQESYERAEQEQDIEAMKKYASRLSRLTEEMVEDAKRLIRAFGLPVVQAASEGEAYAAQLVREGKAYASASEDFDSLLFGSPRLIRQLSVTGRRRKSRRLGTFIVQPEIISLEAMLNTLNLDQDQLIVLGILIGTDFNVGGVHGIGPKKALKLIAKHGHDFDSLFNEAGYAHEVRWQEIFGFFKNPPETVEDSISFSAPDRDRLRALLVDEFEFSEQKIISFFEKLDANDTGQRSLGSYFG